MEGGKKKRKKERRHNIISVEMTQQAHTLGGKSRTPFQQEVFIYWNQQKTPPTAASPLHDSTTLTHSPPCQVKSYIFPREIYRVTNLIYMPHYSASPGQDKFLFTGVHEADLPRMHIPMGEIS